MAALPRGKMFSTTTSLLILIDAALLIDPSTANHNNLNNHDTNNDNNNIISHRLRPRRTQESPNYSAAITSPSDTQCMSDPCLYQYECRSKLGICGTELAYCNSASTWVPACGGGANLVRPDYESLLAIENTSATAPSNSSGAGDAAATTQAAANQAVQSQQMQQQQMQPNPPTLSPTTAWEAFVKQNSGQNDTPGGSGTAATTGSNNDPDAEPKEVVGYSGEEGGRVVNASNYQPPTNEETGWFDKAGWDTQGRPVEEESGFLDTFKFWGEEDEKKEGSAGSSPGGLGATAIGGVVYFSALWMGFEEWI
mmetsp:Transcript_26484/g.54607  ORF Transcript_26484/g.54607 Transcript_26484/m.54607 type:complete len:310 (+) Transcript_26484:44-973(+)